jgi:hypothetical protein
LPAGYTEKARLAWIRTGPSVAEFYRIYSHGDGWYWYNEDVTISPFLVLNNGKGSFNDYVNTLSGLISYWKLTESAGPSTPDSKDGYNGTWTGSPTFGTAGMLANDDEQCVGFAGTQWSTLQSGTQYDGEFSLVIVFKRSSTAGYEYIITRYDAGGTTGWDVGVWEWSATSPLIFTCSKSGVGNKNLYTTFDVDDNTVRIAVINYIPSEGRIKIYVNGDLNKNDTGAPDLGAYSATQFQIGQGTVGGRNYGVNGGTALLEKVLWFNRSLTQTEVTNLSNLALISFGSLYLPVSLASVVPPTSTLVSALVQTKKTESGDISLNFRATGGNEVMTLTSKVLDGYVAVNPPYFPAWDPPNVNNTILLHTDINQSIDYQPGTDIGHLVNISVKGYYDPIL